MLLPMDKPLHLLEIGLHAIQLHRYHAAYQCITPYAWTRTLISCRASFPFIFDSR